MGGCQNYGPFWGTLNIRCRIIIGIQKGTVILTTTHIYIYICHVGTPQENFYFWKGRVLECYRGGLV